MKQFRNSCYWVHPEGKVYKFYPARTYKQKWINKKGEVRLHGNQSKVNGKEYGVDRYVEMKPTIRANGYYCFSFWDKSIIQDKKFFNISLHRMVAECYLGPCPEGYEVDHIDGNKSNNNINNLQYLTTAENRAKGIIQERYGYNYATTN